MTNNDCKFSIKINGKIKRFRSDKDLDLFLKENYADYNVDMVHKTFSADLQKQPKEILNKIRVSYKNASTEVIRMADTPEETETYDKIPNSIGVTAFINKYGKIDNWKVPMSTQFNINKYRRDELARLIDSGLTEDEGKKIIELREKSWPIQSNTGTEIHNIIDAYFSEKNYKSKILSEELTESLKKQTAKFIEELKAKHGQKAEFYTEYAIQSTELNPAMKIILEQAGITSLNGRIDLLVLDEFGNLHIYDFKASWREVGNWDTTDNSQIAPNEYHSTKKQMAENQLAMYRAMLRQQGLTVATTNIVPIVIDYDYDVDEITIKGVNDIRIEKTINDLKKVSPGSKYVKNAEKIFPYTYVKTFNNSLANVFDNFSKILPIKNVQHQVKQYDAKYEYYRNKEGFVKKVSEKTEKGAEGYKYSFVQIDLDNKIIYAKSEEDLNNSIKKYVDELNEKKENELIDLAKEIEMATLNPDSKDFNSIAQGFNESRQAFILDVFKKYVTQHWKLIRNDELNSAGLFVFKKGEESDVLILTNSPLFNKNNLGLGQSILGQYIKEGQYDNTKILPAFNANIEIMKAMAFISENQDLFEGSKINEVKAVNIWHSKQHSNINSMLLDNWNKLLQYNKNGVVNKINPALFQDDATSLVNMANSRHLMCEYKMEDFEIKSDAKTEFYTKQWLEEKIKQLKFKYKKLYNKDTFSTTDDIWITYMYLQKALLNLNGVNVVNELDKGNTVNKGLSGLNITSIQYSDSANAKQLGIITNNFTNSVRQYLDKYAVPMNKVFNDFYEENGRIRAIGGEANYFLSWFRRDPTSGKISKELKLKSPDDPDFDGSPKSKKALQEFLRIINDIRYDGDQDKINNAMLNDSYYEIPLKEAKFNRQVKNMGVKKVASNMIAEVKNLSDDVFSSLVEEKQSWNQNNDKLYNRYKMSSDQRNAIIDEKGVGFFETDLEDVLLDFLVVSGKEKASEVYMPLMTGLVFVLKMNEHIDGIEMKNIIDFCDKYTKKVVLGEPIIEKQLQPVQVGINVVKSVFSKMTLGFNSKSFGREMLQGFYVGANKSITRFIDGVNEKTYIKAFTHVLSEAHKNYSSTSLLQQLCSTYGMANHGLSELAEQKRNNWLGMKNWSSSTAFITSSSPDFQHRMAILVAKMMGDGCWEAHSLDDNDVLKYDFKKDSRFKEYINNNTSHKDYLYQKTKYLKLLEQFNNEGYVNEKGKPLEVGDDLPRAYTNLEGASIKNFGDLMYGHYDLESKAMIGSMLLGSLFTQYRTFIIAKLEQWLMKPNIYNNYNLKQQIDRESGEEIWKIVEYPETNEDGEFRGTPITRYVKKSEVTQEEIKEGRAEPYMEFEGTPLEGIFYSMGSWSKALLTMNTEELSNLWNNKLKRANLIQFIDNMIWMTILAAIITAIFGDYSDVKKTSWANQWSYGVLLGATQDGPIHNILSGIVGDFNPPLKQSIERFVDNCGNVITGDSSLWYAMTQTFGSLREAQGAAKISI